MIFTLKDKIDRVAEIKNELSILFGEGNVSIMIHTEYTKEEYEKLGLKIELADGIQTTTDTYDLDYNTVFFLKNTV